MPDPIVIFDCDGTLLDTEPIYLQCEGAIAAEYAGVSLDEFKKLTPRLLGTVPMDSAKIIIQEYNLSLSPEELLADRDRRTSELFPTVQILPGCERLVSHLKACGVPFGIATSSSRKNFELKMRDKGEWSKLFQAVITGDDVTRGKPDPEIFEKCARALGGEPGPHCIVFEDAPAGVAGGHAAGAMRCVGLQNEFTDASKYWEAGAEVVLHSMADFVPEDFGLPPYSQTEKAPA